jgi:hypothetical protein
MEIFHKAMLCSVKGGRVDFLSYDGEHLASLPVPPGVWPASKFLDLLPDGASAVLDGDITQMLPKSGYGAVPRRHTDYESAANPDFSPSSAAHQEARMRLMVNNMVAEISAVQVEKRLAALGSIERMPTAKLEADPDLIEKSDPDDLKP